MKIFNISILGLDNAGKTSALLRLKGDPSIPPKGSWGFSANVMKFYYEEYFKFLCIHIPFKCATELCFFDLGGDKKFRGIWPNYFADVYGWLFVVDFKDKMRLEEAKEELHKVSENPLMKGKPLLILANNARHSELEDVALDLDIASIINSPLANASDNLVCIKECNLMESSPEELKLGIDWLIRAIKLNARKLTRRVKTDTKLQQQKWKEKLSANVKDQKIHPDNKLN